MDLQTKMTVTLTYSCLSPVEIKCMPSSGPCWGRQEQCGWLHRCDASGQAETLRCFISKWHFLREVRDAQCVSTFVCLLGDKIKTSHLERFITPIF